MSTLYKIDLDKVNVTKMLKKGKNTLFLLLLCLNGFTQKVDTLTIDFEGSKFYKVTNGINSNLLIFLHGGVNNPVFTDSTVTQDLNYLLENNTYYIPMAVQNGFDVLIPIKKDSLNWLTNHEYCYRILHAYMDSMTSHKTFYISGFSDGGTGSYKIFYSHPELFAGLAVFNGYPQYKNFYQNVDYSKVTNKPVLYFSTRNDMTIPYEFLLTEYCKQKQNNANTFFYVAEGLHSFDAYQPHDLNLCFDALTSQITNQKKEAIHGFIQSDTVVNFYTFRKKIYRKFKYGKEYFIMSREQRKQYD